MSAPRTETLLVDVTAGVPSGETLRVAVTVTLPADAPPVARSTTVLFGYPGGGYSRHYFDLEITEGDGNGPYSQARHHAARGSIFVACDHVGVGDSDVPTRPIDYDGVARANNVAAKAVLGRLRSGTLIDGVDAIEPRAVVAMGQSFGGFLLTLAQADDPVFDGVAFLGWSAIRTDPGWPPGTDVESIVRNGTRGEDPANPRRRTYHWPDVPESIIAADLTRVPGVAGAEQPWGATYHPGGPTIVRNRNPVEAGVVTTEAAAITVPVFVGAGEIDVMADPHVEPTAYRGSRDVTVHIVERMGHMHNFATTRRRMWDRIASWADGIESGS